MHIYKRKKRNVRRKQEIESKIHLCDVSINMKETYSAIILEFLEEHYPEWHFGYEFVNCHVVVKGGIYWLGSSADRLARQLSEDGIIDKKREGKYVQFRAKPKPIPSGQVVLQKTLKMV